LLGAAKPRALALTGRVADGWVAPLMNYMPPSENRAAQALIDRAARDAGRDPRAIRRIELVPGAFAPSAAAGERHRPSDRRPAGALGRGPDAPCGRSRPRELRPRWPPDPDALRTFIEDVAPDVRSRVAMARAHTAPVVEERSA